MFGPFKPAPHIAELPAEKIDSTYKRLRWQVFAGMAPSHPLLSIRSISFFRQGGSSSCKC